ncbi:MAG: phosphoglucosamine mutase [Planctomycetota bacterium]|jgi:phosphomannomutase
MMSVSGVRGIVGESMTPQLAAELGFAMGTYLGGGKVVIGRDSRPSGLTLQEALVSGLSATGCEVVQLDIASTPATALMVRKHQAAGGVIITASHNPIEWNGIKFLTDEGLLPRQEKAQELFDIYHHKNFKFIDVTNVKVALSDPHAAHTHVETTLKLVDPQQISANRFRVVLDSVNGAGGQEGRLLLEKLGCEVVHINAEPTGQFTHPPEPLAENLTQLCEAVKENGGHVGFAQDPDADRLAIVDETGRYIGEEYTLALTGMYLFATQPGPTAANLSTSRMIDDLAASAGGPCCVHRSAVGEANVVAVMKAHDCVFGGEGNGGVIDMRVVPVRNSLVAMAYILQLMSSRNQTISQLAGQIPQYTMIKRKFDCSKERIAKVLKAVENKYADQKINNLDGVRIDFPNAWLHVRGSNTEPIIRIIAEAPTKQRAEQLIANTQQIADAVY